jgi:hypothetical protein
MHVSIPFLVLIFLFLFFLLKSSSLNLQEVDKFTDLEKEMAMQGYKGTWKVMFLCCFMVCYTAGIITFRVG